jgi:hypothetical protein
MNMIPRYYAVNEEEVKTGGRRAGCNRSGTLMRTGPPVTAFR